MRLCWKNIPGFECESSNLAASSYNILHASECERWRREKKDGKRKKPRIQHDAVRAVITGGAESSEDVP